MGDAVLPADPVEHHLPAASIEPGGELLAVVREQLLRDAVFAQCSRQSDADCPAGGLRNDSGDDAEPGMVIQPGYHLRLLAVDQMDMADDVHLPELHRAVAFPPLIVLAAAMAGPLIDQAVPDQDPMHRDP